MYCILLFTLITTLLGCLASCDSEFIDPPDLDPKKVRDLDLGDNRRYVVGEMIPLKWKTDLDSFELLLAQYDGSGFKTRPLDNSRTGWEAEYDVLNALENGEDAMYWFMISDPDDRVVAFSVFINVTSAVKVTDEAITITIDPYTVFVPEIISTQQEITSTVEPTSVTTAKETSMSGEQAEGGSESRMTQGEVAGAAVGAIFGGLLIFGGVGWLIWKRRARDKSDSDIAATTQHQQPYAAKVELPGDHAAYPSDFARSPTGVYEAP